MISIAYPISFMVAFAAAGIWMMVEQERLYALFKKKKNSDELLTFKDYFNFERRLGNMNFENSNFGIARRRWKVLFSKYPEDAELNRQASKARWMFGVVFLVWIGGFALMLILALSSPVNS